MNFKFLEYLYYLVEIIASLKPKIRNKDKKIIVEVEVTIIFIKE